MIMCLKRDILLIRAGSAPRTFDSSINKKDFTRNCVTNRLYSMNELSMRAIVKIGVNARIQMSGDNLWFLHEKMDFHCALWFLSFVYTFVDDL